MSVGVVNKTTGDRIPTAGMPAIDSVLSGSSTNPVQNRVVKAALDEKADTELVASDFDATASYTAGNYCIYEGKFYRFKNNHSGAWAAADVDEIQIAGELSSIKSGLIGLGTLHDMVNQSQQDDFVGKYAIIGKICFFSLICTKSQASYTLGMIEGVLPLSNWVLVAYDSTNNHGVFVATAGGNTGTLLQMSTGVLADKVAVSGCFLIQ